MANEASHPYKTRQQIENEMRQGVLQRQAEWRDATGAARDISQQRFLKALQAFTAFTIDGILPDDYKV
jgi:trehalose/maltose hydrolase-like predicted phosphorylase